MCGIVGVISLGRKTIDTSVIKRMCDVIEHRGPDDAGYYVCQTGHQSQKCGGYHLNFTDTTFCQVSPLLPLIDSPSGQEELNKETWNLFLGHRRLAVIDTSAAGHQPMRDKTRNHWVVYNGEIYNFKEIRAELETLGYSFKSDSDTEVILSAYQEWGIECVHRFNGMFAFALWDNLKKKLFLVRDRYGIKPLYYTIIDDVIVFGSEIKSILQYPLVKKELNFEALNEYFTFQNLFQYETLFKGIHLLPPANIATIDFENGFERRCYWDYDFTNRDTSISFEDAVEGTKNLFTKAVERQLVADVPVGAYLSGGMDSGSITAITSRFIPRHSTFTAGFELSRVGGVEATFDERADAELLANEYKTEHFEQVINAGDIAHVMNELIWHMEDLRVGMSYPNYYISRLASKFVTVALSGAGGDELYGGYPWRYYRVCNSLDKEDFLKQYYSYWQRLVSDEDKEKMFHPDVFSKIDIDRPYWLFKRVFNFNTTLKYETPEDHIANSLYFEAKTFLQGLLIIGDKLSMASSLEERFPFLDNELVDFAQKVPISYKLKNLEEMTRINENESRRNRQYFQQHDDGKNVLRKAMRDFLPRSIIERKKQGFSAPDESWYRGENFEFVRERLLSGGGKASDYINRSFVEKTISEHSEGTNHRLLIWSLLCFEEWCDVFLDS